MFSFGITTIIVAITSYGIIINISIILIIITFVSSVYATTFSDDISTIEITISTIIATTNEIT